MLAVSEIVRYLMGDVTLDASPAAQKLYQAALNDVRADISSGAGGLERVLLVENLTRLAASGDNELVNSVRSNVQRLLRQAQSDLRVVDSHDDAGFDQPVLVRWTKLKESELLPAVDEAPATRTFTHTAPMDENGLLYYLGTRGGTRAWKNPAEGSEAPVKTWAASVQSDSKPPSAICGREVVRCVSKPAENQWFAIDLGPHIRFTPTHYTLRHYISWETEALRHWIFQGSNEADTSKDSAWTTLMTHVDDKSLHQKGQAFTWQLPPIHEAYSKFRVKVR